MAGMFVIRPARDPLAAFPSKNLFITDLRLDTAGAIPPNTDDDRLQGREGNHLLVNGVQQPRIPIRPGSIQRWRIVNATNARFLRLALTGHTFRLVGTDGGLLRSPVSRSEILLSPAERIEVLVEASEGGGSFQLLARPYDRHKINQPGASAQVIVATLEYTNESPVNPPRVPNALRTIERLEGPVKQQAVIFNFNGSNQFMVNGRVFDPDRVDLRSRAGDVEEWEVTNLAGMDHPFHIHQAQLQVVSRTQDGQTSSELLAWKDTFNLVPNEIVRFRIRFANRGTNVFHCHILEHEAHGMMGVLEIT
jgi:bilirubin oxidase